MFSAGKFGWEFRDINGEGLDKLIAMLHQSSLLRGAVHFIPRLPTEPISKGVNGEEQPWPEASLRLKTQSHGSL